MGLFNLHVTAIFGPLHQSFATFGVGSERKGIRWSADLPAALLALRRREACRTYARSGQRKVGTGPDVGRRVR